MEVPPTQNSTAPVSLQTSSARLKLTAWLLQEQFKAIIYLPPSLFVQYLYNYLELFLNLNICMSY